MATDNGQSTTAPVLVLRKIKQILLNNTEAACERGAFGIPSFLVGDEIFFGKDRLRDVEEMIVERS